MRLDYLIQIMRKTQVQAADGRLNTTRTQFAEVWANVKPVSGSERDTTDQTEAPAKYSFTIRRLEGVQEDDIIVWQGNDYNIRFVADYGARRLYLRLDAERGVAV